MNIISAFNVLTSHRKIPSTENSNKQSLHTNLKKWSIKSLLALLVLSPSSGFASWSVDALGVAEYQESHGATIPVTIRWNDGNDDGVQKVDLSYGGTAQIGASQDYTSDAASSTLELDTAVSQTLTVNFTINDDALYEFDETVILTISSNPGSPSTIDADNNSATFTILDNDSPPSVSLSLRPDCIEEEGPDAYIIAALSEVTGRETIIDISGVTGTATLVDDYALAYSQIIISPGNRVGFARVIPVNDGVADEGDETVIVSITGDNVTNATVSGTQSVTLTIEDSTSSLGDLNLSFDGRYIAAQTLGGTISVAPADGAATYSVSLPVPTGWTASNISNGGSFNAGTLTIEWTGLTGNQTLTFDVTPGGGTGILKLHATATFPGGSLSDKALVYDEKSGIVVTPTTLNLSEDSDTATFTISISDVPIAPVAIGISSQDSTEAQVSQGVHFFSTKNFDQPIEITVTGQLDNIEDGDQSIMISIEPAQSADPYFAGADGDDVTVNVANVFVDFTSESGSNGGGGGLSSASTDPHPADVDADGTISADENYNYYIANVSDPDKATFIYNANLIVAAGGTYSVDSSQSEPDKWVATGNSKSLSQFAANGPESGKTEFIISHVDKDGTYGLLKAQDGDYQVMKSSDLVNWTPSNKVRVTGLLGLFFEEDSFLTINCYYKVVKIQE